VTVNADQELALAGTFNVSAVPTFMLYRNGVKINELKGGLPGHQLEQWIDASLGSERIAGV
jgi:thioredoxin-like negative regulator of GroEL